MIDFEVKSARAEIDSLRGSGGGVDDVDQTEKLLTKMKMEVAEYFEKNKGELKRFFVQQKNENARLQAETQKLKGENTNLQQGMVSLQRRVKDLESEVGK